MEYIALRTLEALYDTGKLRRIQDLYTLTKEDLVSLEGFGKKKTANFLEQITHRKPMSPMEFIGRLGIPMVQERSLVRLGITSMEDFMNFDDESSLLGKRIVEWKSTPGNLSLLEELLEVVRIEERSGSVERKGVLCLTGKAPMPRKTLIAALERAGWVVADTVTRNTVKVVCDDPGGSSAKLKKSREAGIEIVTYDEFLGEEDLLKQEYPERS